MMGLPDLFQTLLDILGEHKTILAGLSFLAFAGFEIHKGILRARANREHRERKNIGWFLRKVRWRDGD